MFRFNFSSENPTEEASQPEIESEYQAMTCVEIVPAFEEEEEEEDSNFKEVLVDSLIFYVRDLNNRSNLNFVMSYKDCDVIPTIYEGGLKIWECTYDLLKFLSQNNVDFFGKEVCDLGCGSGLLGIYSSWKKAKCVHFQDYNADVLTNFTIPNCKQNKVQSETKFFAGDWDSFTAYSSQLYDYILCSEILYSPSSYPKLGKLFEQKLRVGGKIILASKSYYFGIGGSVQQFEQFFTDTGFSWQSAWKTSEGVQREILIISKLNT